MMNIPRAFKNDLLHKLKGNKQCQNIMTRPENPYKIDGNSQLYQVVYKTIRGCRLMPSVGRYNITISHEGKFIWFRVAKVATRTILHLLSENNIVTEAVHPIFIHFPINHYADYFKFAFIRNPWDRLVSCWNNKVVNSNYYNFSSAQFKEMQTYSKFVNYVSKQDLKSGDPHLCLQSKLIDLNNIDFVGRFENLEIDLKYAMKKIGLEIETVPKKNMGKGKKKYQDYYNSELKEKVGNIYKKDIELFGYEFNN